MWLPACLHHWPGACASCGKSLGACGCSTSPRSPALQTPPAQGTPLPVLPSPAAEGSDGQRASEGSKGSGPERSCSACHRGGLGSGSLVKWGPGSGGPNAGKRFSFSLPPSLLSFSLFFTSIWVSLLSLNLSKIQTAQVQLADTRRKDGWAWGLRCGKVLSFSA